MVVCSVPHLATIVGSRLTQAMMTVLNFRGIKLQVQVID